MTDEKQIEKLETKKKKLQQELETIRKKSSEKLTQIMTAEPDEIRKLAVEKGELDNQDKSILAALAALDYAINQQKELDKHEAALKRAEKVDADLQHVERTKYLCPSCDGVLKFVGPRRLSGLGIYGSAWKQVDPPFPYVVALNCKSCGTQFLRSHDELTQLEQASQRVPKPRKLAKSDTFAGEF